MSAPETTKAPSPDSTPDATSQANLSMVISHSLGIAAQNAVVAQQMGNVLHSAVTAVGVETIFSNTPTKTSPKSLTEALQEMQSVIDALKSTDQKADHSKAS